ncbi:MAG TPA: hypothetical protein PK308_04120, partial [Phycisphaerales bacterium]|nr:hypothetical protein [Phycisphaerales bacterium]
VQAQMQQMQQQMQEMQQGVQQLQAENQQLRAGAEEKRAKIEADAALAQTKAQGEANARVADAEARKLEAQLAADEAVEAARIKAEADAQAKIQSKMIEVAGDIIGQALAARFAPVAPVEGAPVEAPLAAPAVPDLAQVVAALQETVASMAQQASTPRRVVLERGPDGRVVAGVSSLVQ